MFKWNLCDYSDAYIFDKGIKSMRNTAAGNNENKEVTFKNCAPFTDCISEINNIGEDNIKDIDVLALVNSLIEYDDNYSNTSGKLWWYYKDKSALNNAGNFIDFLIDGNSSIPFRYIKI